MIELYDIVESASKLLKDRTLILHRNIKEHPKFKIYKIYCYNLYQFRDNQKYLIFSSEMVKNTPAEDMLQTWEECDKLYLRELIKYIASDDFKSLINGV